MQNFSNYLREIDASWLKYLEQEFEQEYFQKTEHLLNSDYNKNKIIYPRRENIMQAFRLTPLDKLKEVILGQDPYHGENQAHGLAFSVESNPKLPPSLKNIYKELAQDLNIPIAKHGNLSHWAKQGVLLLNTSLTVEKGEANSHAKYGWQLFTDRVIEIISQNKQSIIFLLWGAPAQTKIKLIDQEQHYILTAPHPSPLSAHRGFLGCKHFSKTNELLRNNSLTPIDWNLN